MKKIYMVFNDKEKISVSAGLYENLKYVFEDYVKIVTCFLDEVEPEDIADGDLFIVLYENRIYSMKKYISSLEKVIVVTRTIQKQFLSEILSIPEGTDVLVVNDSDESTLQTANNLYALGLNHLNFVPYISGGYTERYKDIHIAVTPGEANMVPSFIDTVIDIGERFVDLGTLLNIIGKLNLKNEQITRNLIRYTSLIALPNKGANQRSVDEHIKSEMLKTFIHDVQEAVVLTDNSYNIVYVNRTAEKLFLHDLAKGETLREMFPEEFDALTAETCMENALLLLGEVNYMVSKKEMKILDQMVGYAFSFKDEKNIKNIESDLSKQLVKSGLVAKYTFASILGNSAKIKGCIEKAKKAALTDYTVLINGESGSGKELFAQSIHNYSRRKNHPFVAINCAALPEALLESELFGYEKGAFTGASGNGKIGLFEKANRGTIFLDEIGDMSLNLQARLLRVLQEKQIMRLGSDKVINVDIRIVAATNKNLKEAIQTHEFREDLYFRLCNLPINLPALRERREDILPLFQAFLGKDYGRLSEEECRIVESYSWTGNVRELKNAAEYYCTLGELPENLYQSKPKEELKNAADKPVSVEEKVLHIIKEHTGEASGIGRTAIIYMLYEDGFSLSDDKTRRLLAKMDEEGLIIIGKGRAGCRITEKGRKALAEK